MVRQRARRASDVNKAIHSPSLIRSQFGVEIFLESSLGVCLPWRGRGGERIAFKGSEVPCISLTPFTPLIVTLQGRRGSGVLNGSGVASLVTPLHRNNLIS